MIPDFPHIMKILLAPLIFFLLHPDFAKSFPFWLSQFNSSQVEMEGGQARHLSEKNDDLKYRICNKVTLEK